MRTEPDALPLIEAVPQLPTVRVISAKYQRPQRRHRPIWIVLHCTAGAEGPHKAFDGAMELANCSPLRKRSAHYFVDTSEVIQCVRPDCEAWHAGTHANVYGIGIELCGQATQTREQWLDALSLPMLNIAARLVRDLCDAYAIPAQLLGPADLQRYVHGITTHATISSAFPRETNHTDPGAGFPLTEFVNACRR